MIKTKIICTIGPASESPEMLEKLAKAGMTIARLNFSHGDYKEHELRFKRLRELSFKLEVPLAIMLDTQGPEIRLGIFKEKVMLQEGEETTLTTREISCDNKLISISYKKLPQTVKTGDYVYIADGTIELKVKKIEGTEVLCEIIVGGEVSTKKNVNIPGAIIDLPSISEKDREDIKFGVKHSMDFVAQSFVRTAQDVINMKQLLKENNSEAHVIAKIECMEALKNVDEIIKVADGIMVARGDLGVQIPIEQVANAQKLIIKKCDCAAKPVIVATQMLESMTKNPRPTRAEVTDVANAIFDGADAIMLSGETAAGKYPLRAVEMMTLIAKQTETKIDYTGIIKSCKIANIEESISRAICQTAYEINASAIITCTYSGKTARMISKNRPSTMVIAVTPNMKEIKKLNLCWGVYPLSIPNPQNTDDLIQNAVEATKKKNLLKNGDVAVITAGIPFNTPGNINFMKVHVID